MRLDLFNMNEFIELNNLQEVTSPIIFERGIEPNPDGLISNRIFGINVASRKETFAYIDLGGKFFSPAIYKSIKRVYRNIDRIIIGSMRCKLNEENKIVEDPNGETGIGWLYKVWNKINWGEKDGTSKERVELMTQTKKDLVFIDKFLVIPPFYRDISTKKGGGGDSTVLNNLYSRLIRMADLIKGEDMFNFAFHTTNYNIQNTLVEVYDFFKLKLHKKHGLFHKYLLGKNVDNCTRSVISAPLYKTDRPEDNIYSVKYTVVPIEQICVLVYPFLLQWLKNFFEIELFENKYSKWKRDDKGELSLLELKNPEAYYNEKYLKKRINKFIKDASSRFDLIEIPTNSTKQHYLIFTGKEVSNQGEDSATISDRYMTWLDLIYIACEDIVKDKHIMNTRYPITDPFGIFINKIRINSTRETVPVMLNEKLYKWYPKIDLKMNKSDVAKYFIGTLIFSNAFLEGIVGDYDGETCIALPTVMWVEKLCELLGNSKALLATA